MTTLETVFGDPPDLTPSSSARAWSRMLTDEPSSETIASRKTPEPSWRAQVTWNALAHLPFVHWTVETGDERGRRQTKLERRTLRSVLLGAELALLQRGESVSTWHREEETRTTYELPASLLDPRVTTNNLLLRLGVDLDPSRRCGQKPHQLHFPLHNQRPNARVNMTCTKRISRHLPHARTETHSHKPYAPPAPSST